MTALAPTRTRTQTPTQAPALALALAPALTLSGAQALALAALSRCLAALGRRAGRRSSAYISVYLPISEQVRWAEELGLKLVLDLHGAPAP